MRFVPGYPRHHWTSIDRGFLHGWDEDLGLELKSNIIDFDQEQQRDSHKPYFVDVDDSN
jgi:hypothetical protein